MSALDLVRMAVGGVRLHRVRSVLTAAGFAAGTAAAIALAATTGGARAELLRQLDELGHGILTVRAVGRNEAGRPLMLADGLALEGELDFVAGVAPVRLLALPVRLGDSRETVRVVGTSADYFALRPLRFFRGRPFDQADVDAGRRVAVLGAEAVRRLGDAGAYGQRLRIGEDWYRVIGVLASDFPVGTDSGGGSQVYVPIPATLRGNLSPRQEIREIVLRLGADVDPERAAEAVRRTLQRRLDGSEPFEVLTAEALLRQRESARGILDGLLVAVAALAFLLGGVGMGGLAMQAATERRREIAIRRAVGATREAILAQFLVEGAVVAGVGATAGVLAGGLVAWAAASIGGWPLSLSTSVFAAPFVALAVGLAATIVPAIRAARLDPVEALRFDG